MREPAPPPDFAHVYDEWFDRVYGYVRCRVSSRDEADELVSLVFEKVLDGVAGFRPERGSFEVWLFSVARHAVYDHYRSWWRRSRRPLEDAGPVPSPEPGTHERLEAEEDKGRLLAAVARLGDRQRDVLAMKFQARLTNREIAGVLGLGESHVGVLVFRALRELRSALAGEEKNR